MKAKGQNIEEQLPKEQNVVENAWKEYYLMRWNHVTKMEMEE
jgi:hypothetical protein